MITIKDSDIDLLIVKMLGIVKVPKVIFITDEEEQVVEAPIGLSILEIAHRHDIELEGACEGSLACATCHVIIVDQDRYDQLAPPSEAEEDMLDLAFGLTQTSRLGCQIIITEQLDGIRVRVPSTTRNINIQ